MILSRAWYVLLGLAVAVSLYVVYIAVGEYDRQATRALIEGLASDSQTVEWELKIDARRRLDALLAGSVDGTLQQALVSVLASKDGKVPEKSKAEAKKALSSIRDAIPADWRSDALFAVDRDGHVVAQLGYDAAPGNEEFELGGYAAVNDALHGWLRDDIWILAGKLYFVVARPVEFDATQRPAGAIVGLKEVNSKLALDLAKRSRTNLSFYAGANRVADGVGTVDFESEKLDALGNDLKSIDNKSYRDGRTEARMLGSDLGALYARLPGDAWPLGGGFAVLRSKTTLASPLGFLRNADDKDKANVPWPLLAAVVVFAAAVGIGLTMLEHGVPLRQLNVQAERLRVGAADALQVAQLRGGYRRAAQAINDGLERAIEKAGGVTRKPADLESILGPTPAQPAMSAFSLPTADRVEPPSSTNSVADTGTAATAARAAVGPPPPSAPKPPVPKPPAPAQVKPPATRQSNPVEDDATTVSQVPAEVMAQAAGNIVEERSEWEPVYQEFVRAKKQCGEPTSGLTFEKFAQKLRENRDVLTARHGCKRVKFSVYVKEGRASLKAVPVKE